MYDKMYFNIANAVVFIVFVLLIYYMAMNKKVSNSFLILEYALLLCGKRTISSTLTNICRSHG